MDRKGFIGGSDMYALEHGNWFDLWQIKTGRKEPDDLSHMFNVNLGNETELFNMRWFEIQTGVMVEQTQVVVEKNWSGIPCRGTLDGICSNDNIIEAKHTSSFSSMSDILDRYMGQVQFYMWLADRPAAHLSVIFGNKWETATVTRNAALMDQYLEMMHGFWDYVRADSVPPTNDMPKTDWSQVEIDGLKVRDANNDNHFVSLAHDYVSTLFSHKQHESIKKELRSMIRDDEREVTSDLVSIKRSKNGSCRIVIHTEEVSDG